MSYKEGVGPLSAIASFTACLMSEICADVNCFTRNQSGLSELTERVCFGVLFQDSKKLPREAGDVIIGQLRCSDRARSRY